MSETKFTFLEEQILSVLESAGLNNLSEENKKRFLPQLSAEAEYRLGLGLLPLLNEEQGEVLTGLIEKEAGAEEFAKFWQDSVPNLKDVISKILTDFGEECHQILSK